MKLWMKKMLFLSVSIAVIYMCVGWGAAVMPIDPLAHTVVATTVNPLYQLGCPSDSGVPSWLCTQLSQENNNNNALKTGITSSTAGNIVSRVIDGGVALNGDGAYGDATSYAPSTGYTRIVGSYPAGICVTGGTFDASEVVVCEMDTIQSDGTDAGWDGGIKMTMDAAGPYLVHPASSNGALSYFRKDGTYISSLQVKCKTDAGTNDKTVYCALQMEQQ
jgi:hypothetical protein